MNMHLNLSADEVLTTTRAVRKRLELGRSVDPVDIRDCLEIALQAPTGSNRQVWHFVVVTDPATIAKLGDIYRRAMTLAKQQVSVLGRIEPSNASYYDAQTARVMDSASYLGEIIDRVPGVLIPCVEGNFAELSGAPLFSLAGSVIQAAWSFMLAARNRGIGTVWTTVHLALEGEIAELLGIPYPSVSQVALIPFGYTVGTNFKQATREPLDRVLHWDNW
ncbi:MAG: nitroreductase family protein [Acidimicrobiales bacterium]